jgi:protein TonB
MKRENRLRSIAFCASAMLHAGLVFFLTAPYQGVAGGAGLAGAPEPGAGVFALVNVSVQEEPVPASLPPVEPPPEPVPAMPEPENAPAEIFIVAEEIPPEAEGPAVPVELTAAFPADSGAAAAGTPREAGRGGPEAERNAALAETYVRRNFTYIQRRIRDRLRYPPQARRAGIQGTVEVGFTVHRDGAVSAVVMLVSSGQESLDQAAMAAVRAAAPFPPPPAQARLSIPVAFRLR